MNTATPEQLVHDLAYVNYRTNRYCYGASYEQWILAIGPDAAQEFEERYQAEIRHECPRCCQWCTCDTPEECSHVCEDVAELRDSAKGEA